MVTKIQSDPWRPVLLALLEVFFIGLLLALYPFSEMLTLINAVILLVILIRLGWYSNDTGWRGWEERSRQDADAPFDQWRGVILAFMSMSIIVLIIWAWPPICWFQTVFAATIFSVLAIRYAWYQNEPGKRPDRCP